MEAVDDPPIQESNSSGDKSTDESPSYSVRCEICGQSFPTRSAKQYHKLKFPRGTKCNVPSAKGRPPLDEVERKIRRKETKRLSRLRLKMKKK